jgi:hypothetical protein
MMVIEGQGDHPSYYTLLSLPQECKGVSCRLERVRRSVKANKPLLNQVNYLLLHIYLPGTHELKPTHEQLKD